MAESGIGLLLAGTDTSGQGSTAALMMVALFPQVLEKLREEQEKVGCQGVLWLSTLTVSRDINLADSIAGLCGDGCGIAIVLSVLMYEQ